MLPARPSPAGSDPVQRTIGWVDGAIELIDQTCLPQDEVTLRITEVDELIGAIQRLST